ncbi:hypothetical protein PG984_012909 [Apiospora sp. TS-2023a]
MFRRQKSSSSKEKTPKAGEPDPEQIMRALQHELLRIHYGRRHAPTPIPTRRSANVEKAAPVIEGDPTNTRRFRLLVVWGFTTITILVSHRWIWYKEALQQDLAAIQAVKARMGCGSMSSSEFKAFLESGRLNMMQQMIWYEFEQRFANRAPGFSTTDLGEVVLDFKGHWTCSLENLEKGRYHTLLLTVFAHSNVVHLLSTLVLTPHLLSLAFRSCLFKPWSVVLLMAGSEVASNLGSVGRAWLALRASPPDPEDATMEREINECIRRRGCLGASGMFSGVTAALACLYPTARLLRFVPLWLFVPCLMLSELRSGFPPQGLREGFRKDMEAKKRSEVRSESKRDSADHAAHLAGAAFGVFFAILKWRLGSRL